MSQFASKFAPSERSNMDELLYQRKLISSSVKFLDAMLNISNIAVILNKNRQIVYSNKALLDLLNIQDENLLIGKRPGESLNCPFSKKESGGCGTSENCSLCGATHAILESQKKLSRVTSEVRITTVINGSEVSIELSVTATSLIISKELFTIFSAIDISDTKRKQVLDRIFFHDVINTAGGIKGLAQMTLKKVIDESLIDLISTIVEASNILMDEIQAQRDLTLAENNELHTNFCKVEVLLLFKNVASLYQSHDIAKNKTIVVQENSPIDSFECDPVLIRRILGNLVKNALEASESGMEVNIGCCTLPDKIEFYVHNQTGMPRNVELQIFQRSFSTKAINRGLGTYSVKLLTERYLMGSVTFETSEENGTTFRVRLPLVHK